ncbi:hypothetical protein [Natronomonas marina]|uniref:hypothetical protein n=1 Tax=Natronomonas marina TaxID=2961939 RepID=UPI0020C9D53A|nr:hypothetical protein [Natronomonas marina]
MPNLKQKKNGDFIIHKNTDNVPSAPPVSTFQVDSMAVRILAELNINDGDYIDEDTFWSLFDIGLLDTRNEDYKPSIPGDLNVDDLDLFEGFDILEQSKFVSELLSTHDLEDLTDSNAVIEIATQIDQEFQRDNSNSELIRELVTILKPELSRLLSSTPFEVEILFNVCDVLGAEEQQGNAGGSGGPLLWTFFLNQFFEGFEDIDHVLTDIVNSSKDSILFEIEGFVVAATCETWYFVGATNALSAVPEDLTDAVCSFYDPHELFLTDMPKLVRAQIQSWFPYSGKYASSLGDILTKSNPGYLIALPKSDAVNVPVISLE